MRGTCSAVIRHLHRNSLSNYRTAPISTTQIRTAANGNDGHTVTSILEKVSNGTFSVERAKDEILQMKTTTPGEIPIQLKPFANLDHDRAVRTSFPEVVFAQGKTSQQLVAILDDMAHNVNELVRQGEETGAVVTHAQKAILATRVSQELYEQILSMPLKNGTISYHETAKIVTVTASALHAQTIAKQQPPNDIPHRTDSLGNDPPPTAGTKIIVACAGTTDIPVAEEAAVTLEAAGCRTERIYDVGVAGLHRIINALPRLRHPDVGCVIVCAGMDGALPSVVAGLVGVPVVAVPTSVGYGASFGGVGAMLTMLNSCAPGVGVVNIDNGFGAAALAHKCIKSNGKSPG